MLMCHRGVAAGGGAYLYAAKRAAIIYSISGAWLATFTRLACGMALALLIRTCNEIAAWQYVLLLTYLHGAAFV